MNEKMLDLLYRSFDDELSEEEQKEFDHALSSLPEFREERDRILEMRQMVSKNAKPAFKPYFSKRVMRQIKELQSEQEDWFGALTWVFRRFALAGAIAAAIFCILNFRSADGVSLDSALAMPQLQIEDTWALDDLTLEERN